MDLATIQIKVDTRQVKAANEDIKQLGTTGQMTGKKVNAANDDMAKSAKSTTSAFKLLGGAMAALGVGALVTSFARTVTESEKLKGSLKTMTGSTEDAAFAFSELERFAAQTPFTLDQSVEGFIKLKALGLDPSERALRSYGNTSAAMGKDMMQMIEAVADASTGEFERLKEFGIKASSEGDRVSLTFQGMTTTIGKNSAEIQEYLLGIGETKFGSAMEDQMAALPGLLSNLSDNISGLFRKIGDVGGINLFAGAITAASTVIVGITNNLDLLGTGLAAAMAGFVAFTVGSNFSAILGGMGKIRTAVLALNTAIMANPIGFIASAIAIAATAIIINFDKVKDAAARAAINIQIGFEELKIFLMESFAGAIDKVASGFTTMKNDAVAGMTALAAAVKNPTDAINTFNETFDTTLASLQTGQSRTNIYSASIAASRDRVKELNDKLVKMNDEVSDADDNYRDAGRSLSDYATEIDESAVAANELAAETEAARIKTEELLGEISNETEALSMSNVEIAIRNNLQKAGVDATSELGEQIVAATEKLYAEKDAIDAANESAKALEKQHDESQKAIEKEAKRVSDEATKAYERMKDNISGFFVDTFENGKVNFEKIATSFKNMIIKMLADWAASKIMELMTNTFSGIGSSISSMFSGIFSSISSSISGLASSAAAVVGNIVTGGTAAAAATTNATALAAGSGLTATAAGTAAGFTAGGSGVLAAGGGTTAAGTALAGGGTTAAGTALAGGGAVAGGTALAAGGTVAGGTALAGTINTAALSSSLATGTTGFTAGGSGILAGTTQITGLGTTAAGTTAAGTTAAGTTASTTAAGTAAAAGNPIVSALKTFGPAAIFAYLAFKWDIFGLNRPNYPTFDELPPAVQAEQMLEAFNASLPMSLIGPDMEDTEGMAGFEPAILVDLYRRIEGQLGEDGTDTLEKIRNHPLLQTSLYDMTHGSFRSGLDFVPHDGFVAELHAGERVQTAEQARSSDSMADQISGLRQSVEEVMIAVARNTGKLYRLNDRWDKNGLPPVRA
jgi:predicted  nucleic acid-binding Zn-ribbon protein